MPSVYCDITEAWPLIRITYAGEEKVPKYSTSTVHHSGDLAPHAESILRKHRYVYGCRGGSGLILDFLDFAFRILDFGFVACPKPSWYDIPNMTNKLILGLRALLNTFASVRVKS
jgi:hypothetical protein